MANFDKILKKGQDAAIPRGSQKISEWTNALGVILYYLNMLNGMYEDPLTKNFEIETTKCDKCGMVSYLIIAPDLENLDNLVTFNAGNWKVIDESTYRCPNC